MLPSTRQDTVWLAWSMASTCAIWRGLKRSSLLDDPSSSQVICTQAPTGNGIAPQSIFFCSTPSHDRQWAARACMSSSFCCMVVVSVFVLGVSAGWGLLVCAGSWLSVVIPPVASWLPSAGPASPVSAWTAAFCAGATAVPCRKDFKASTNVSTWSSPRVPFTISFPGTTGNVSDLLYLHFMSLPAASTSPLRFHWCIDAGSDKR